MAQLRVFLRDCRIGKLVELVGVVEEPQIVKEDAGAFEIPLEIAKKGNCIQIQRYQCSKERVGGM